MSLNWQYGLLILGVLWGVQVLGTMLQMRHYRSVLNEVTTRWRDGYVGTGAAHASLGRGAIAILVRNSLAARSTMCGKATDCHATTRAWFRPSPVAPGRSRTPLADTGQAAQGSENDHANARRI